MSTRGPYAGYGFVMVVTWVILSAKLTWAGEVIAWGNSYVDAALMLTGRDFESVAYAGAGGVATTLRGELVAFGEYDQSILPLGEGFSEVVLSGDHGMALRPNGEIVSWGNVIPPSGNGYLALATSGFLSVAIRVDGTLDSWSAFGPLTPPAGKFVDIDCAGIFAAGVTTSGTIVAWSIGDASEAFLNPPAGLYSSVSVSADGSGIAIRANGALEMWGSGLLSLEALPSGSDYVDVVAGLGHALALTSSGTLSAWGTSAWGAALEPLLNVPTNSGHEAIACNRDTPTNCAAVKDAALIIFREREESTWDCAGGLIDCIPGWDHVGLSFDGLVYESHPGANHPEYWDPIQEVLHPVRSINGVQAVHTPGSFMHISPTTTTDAVTALYAIPYDLAERMVDFIRSQQSKPFLRLCPQADIDCWLNNLQPILQKGFGLQGEYTCCGLVERAAEEAGHNGGAGFILDSEETYYVPNHGDIPTLSPMLLASYIEREVGLPARASSSESSNPLFGVVFGETDFVLSDSLGRRLGHTTATGILDEIPNALYPGRGAVQEFVLFAPPVGEYFLEVFGTGEMVELAVGGAPVGMRFSAVLAKGESVMIGINALARGDADSDSDVDLHDWRILTDCMSGPDTILIRSGCSEASYYAADGDRDGDVDLVDAAAAQIGFGPR